MKAIQNILRIASQMIHSIASLFYNFFILADSYMLKSDEEMINELLKTDQDKAKFYQELNNMIRENEVSRVIEINNKKITISI